MSNPSERKQDEARLDSMPKVVTRGEITGDTEFDRLLMRLRIIKDWLLRGAKPIGEDTRNSAAADIDLAHAMIAHLYEGKRAAETALATAQRERDEAVSFINDDVFVAARAALSDTKV